MHSADLTPRVRARRRRAKANGYDGGGGYRSSGKHERAMDGRRRQPESAGIKMAAADEDGDCDCARRRALGLRSQPGQSMPESARIRIVLCAPAKDDGTRRDGDRAGHEQRCTAARRVSTYERRSYANTNIFLLRPVFVRRRAANVWGPGHTCRSDSAAGTRELLWGRS